MHDVGRDLDRVLGVSGGMGAQHGCGVERRALKLHSGHANGVGDPDPDRGQAQPGGGGPAAGGDQQLLGVQLDRLPPTRGERDIERRALDEPRGTGQDRPPVAGGQVHVLVARIPSTRRAVAARSAATSTGPALVAMPGNRCSSETWRASAAVSSALDGTHPVLTQVPPTVPCSINATEQPMPLAAIAAANPAAPEPMMARS